MNSGELEELVRGLVASQVRKEKYESNDMVYPSIVLREEEKIYGERRSRLDKYVQEHNIDKETVEKLMSRWLSRERNWEKAESWYNTLPVSDSIQKLSDQVFSLQRRLLKKEWGAKETEQAFTERDLEEVEQIEQEVFPEKNQFDELIADIKIFIIGQLFRLISSAH